MVGWCAGSESCIELMHQKPGRESESGCVREVREVRVVRDVTEVRVVSVLAVGGLDAGGLVCRQRILYRTDASETGS